MTVIDVRTKGEFNGANVPGSINIPLSEIPTRITELSKFETPIVLCCASWNRSGQATQYLQDKGITFENGGSWMNVNSL